MIFGQADNRLRDGETAAAAPLSPSSLGERWSAAVDAQLKAYNLNSDWTVKEAEFDTASDGIFSLTGVRLDNPFRDGLADAMDPDAIERRTGRNPVTFFESEIERLANERPDKARQIRSFSRVLERAHAKRNAAVSRLEDMTARSPGAVNFPLLGPVDPVALAGGMYGSLGDPATIAVNAIGVIGKGGTLLYHFMRSALINAGAEVVQQPFIKQWANEAGDPYGWDEAARSVAAAALLGGALDLGIRGGFRGIQAARGFEPMRERGLITGWRSPEERASALDAAVARLPTDSPVRRAAEGDVAAVREIAETTGTLEDPALRGAILAREMADDLEGPPAMDVDGGEGFASLAQALRAATDPGEPPPAVLASLAGGGLDMNREARLSRAAEMGFDTVQTWHHGTRAKNIESFDLQRTGTNLALDPDGEPAVWFASTYEAARPYGKVMPPFFLRSDRQMVVDASVRPDLLRGAPVPEGKTPTNTPYAFAHDIFEEELKKARSLGYDSVRFNNVIDEGGHVADQVAVFDPANIRSIDAAFDPADAANPRLLASLPREARRAMAAEAIGRTDQLATHEALLGARRSSEPPSPSRLDDPAGADAKAQTDRLERDFAAAIEAANTEILRDRAKAIAGDAGDVAATAKRLAIAEGRYVHTHMVTERMAEIRADIARATKMLPRDVRVRVQERLSGGAPMDGAWDGFDRIVYLALDAPDTAATLRHETIHALRQTGLMTNAEFDTLYRFAERIGLREAAEIDARYGSAYRKAYGDRGEAGVEALLREETIAEMFAAHQSGRRFANEHGKPGRAIDKIFDAISKFLARVREALTGRKLATIDDIFEAIESGEMAARADRRPMVSFPQDLADAKRDGGLGKLVEACRL